MVSIAEDSPMLPRKGVWAVVPVPQADTQIPANAIAGLIYRRSYAFFLKLCGSEDLYAVLVSVSMLSPPDKQVTHVLLHLLA